MPERCVDASVGIKWVVKGEPYRGKARKFLQDSLTGGITLIAPPLFEYETESVIQTKVGAVFKSRSSRHQKLL